MADPPTNSLRSGDASLSMTKQKSAATRSSTSNVGSTSSKGANNIPDTPTSITTTLAPPNAMEFEPPLACVRRILKHALPSSTNVGKDASAAFARSTGIFILYVTACANDFARENKRQTITANDVLAAVRELDFEEFTPEMSRFLEHHRKQEKEKKDAKEAKKQATAADKMAAQDEQDNDDSMVDMTTTTGPSLNDKGDDNDDDEDDVYVDGDMEDTHDPSGKAHGDVDALLPTSPAKDMEGGEEDEEEDGEPEDVGEQEDDEADEHDDEAQDPEEPASKRRKLGLSKDG